MSEYTFNILNYKTKDFKFLDALRKACFFSLLSSLLSEQENFEALHRLFEFYMQIGYSPPSSILGECILKFFTIETDSKKNLHMP